MKKVFLAVFSISLVAGATGIIDNLPDATPTSRGVMTAADKSKLNGISPGAVASPLTTKGDLWTFSTINTRIPVGADGYQLVADSSQMSGLKWQAVTVYTAGTGLTLSGNSFSLSAGAALANLANGSVTDAKLTSIFVKGPTLSADQNLVVFSGTSGALIADSAVSIDNVPTTGEALALSGTSGVPGSSNKYVTNSDSRLSDSRSPTGSAGGDLSGSYPSPTVSAINGVALGSTTSTSGNLLIGSGTQWITHALSGDCSVTSGGAITCTKTNGSAFATSATTDTTNASNISSGTLSNSRTTATDLNTASTIVARDASGNFSAGTITADLTGTASGNLTSSSTLNGANLSSGSVPNTALANSAVANLSGTNSGDVSIGTFGLSPTAKGASLSGQVLTMQPFDSTHPGEVPSGGSSSTFLRGDATWATPTDTGITSLTGDVTASGSGSVAATVAKINGATLGTTTATSAHILVADGSDWQSVAESGDCSLSSAGAQTCTKTNGVSFAPSATTDTTNASNISGGTISNARTTGASANTVSTLVLRDSSGNFSAGTITASLTGTASGNLTSSSTLNGANLSAGSVANSALTNGAVANLSGTNTGDVTLSAVGASPNANGASLSGQSLNLQPFDGTNPGVVTASGGGSSNFLRADGTWTTPAGTGITALTGDVAASGSGSVAATVTKTNGVSFATSATTDTTNASNITTGTLGNGQTTATSSNTVSAIVARDANGIFMSNESVDGFTEIATAGTTTTITASSHPIISFTGSSTQNIVFPDATTLPNGMTYLIINSSTGAITVKNNGNSNIGIVAASGWHWKAILSSNSTSNGSWLIVEQMPTQGTPSSTVNTIVIRDSSGNFSAGTVTAALTGTASGNTSYTANNHGVVLSGSTNAMTVVAPDASTAKVLTSGGTSADPTWSNSPALSGANFTSASIPNSATTATDANTASDIVARDASGNFSAGTITAALTGTASGNLTLASPSQHGILLSGTANATTALASAGTNNFLVGSSGADPIWKTPTQATALFNNVTQSLAGLVASAGQLLGTNTSDTASAGNVGEVMTINLASGSANALSTGTTCNLTATTCPATGGTESITLTAGDWDCHAMFGLNTASTTSWTLVKYGISATSNTMPASSTAANPTSGEVYGQWTQPAAVPGSSLITFSIPNYRVSVTTTKQLFPVIVSNFTASTMNSWGSMQCRRMR